MEAKKMLRMRYIFQDILTWIAILRSQLLKGNIKCILKQKNNYELPKNKLVKQNNMRW